MSARNRKTSAMSSENQPERGPGRPPIDNPADHQIHWRVTGQRKGAYVKAARKSVPAEKLNAWMERHLDKAAREAGCEPEPKEEQKG